MKKKVFLLAIYIGVFFYLAFYAGLNAAKAGNVAKGGNCSSSSDCVSGLWCNTYTVNNIFSGHCEDRITTGTTCASGLGVTEAELKKCKEGCIGGLYYNYLKKTESAGRQDYRCGTEATADPHGAKPTYITDPSEPGTPGPGGSTAPSNLSGMKIPGTTEPGGIIKCGRGGQNMCTLCDMIKGFYDIIDYIMKIAIGVALVAIAIGGILYTVSAGDSGAAEKAKTTIKNALIGFIIVFSAWLIVNTTIRAIGARSDLGINVTGWGDFDCNANKGAEAGAKNDAKKDAKKFDSTSL